MKNETTLQPMADKAALCHKAADCLAFVFCCSYYGYCIWKYPVAAAGNNPTYIPYVMLPISLAVLTLLTFVGLLKQPLKLALGQIVMLAVIAAGCLGWIFLRSTFGNETMTNCLCTLIAVCIFAYHLSRSSLVYFFWFLSAVLFIQIGMGYQQFFAGWISYNNTQIVTGCWNTTSEFASYLLVSYPLLLYTTTQIMPYASLESKAYWRNKLLLPLAGTLLIGMLLCDIGTTRHWYVFAFENVFSLYMMARNWLDPFSKKFHLLNRLVMGWALAIGAVIFVVVFGVPNNLMLLYIPAVIVLSMNKMLVGINFMFYMRLYLVVCCLLAMDSNVFDMPAVLFIFGGFAVFLLANVAKGLREKDIKVPCYTVMLEVLLFFVTTMITAGKLAAMIRLSGRDFRIL